jgi:hypothetical protein
VAQIPQESDFDRAKRWGKKFLAEWKAGTNGRPGRGRGAESQSPQGDIAYMLAQRDCWPAHVRAMGQNSQLHRLVIGTGGNGNLYLTHARRNLLILGPPRSQKTAGVLIPSAPRPGSSSPHCSMRPALGDKPMIWLLRRARSVMAGVTGASHARLAQMCRKGGHSCGCSASLNSCSTPLA